MICLQNRTVNTRAPAQAAAAPRPIRVANARRSTLARADTQKVATGVVFEPMTAAKAELATVEKVQESTQSFARVGYHPECEAAVNEQINIELNVSYIYHALFAYFDRDNVALPGMAKYFKEGSLEERGHAEMLMEYQNRRGGRVALKNILMPEMEFNNSEKGEALYAMELALSLEKLNFSKLRELHAVGSKHEDASMTDFIEGGLLDEQIASVKRVSEYVSQLRRVGKGLGVYQFDKSLA